MNKFNMEVSKKENGAYVKVGEVEVFYPTLKDLGIDVDPSKESEEGFPIYADDRHQYVFEGVLAAVKANARNKLVSGTATLKDGLKIAETVEELMASGGNTGEALKVLREMLAGFKAWLPSTGKSAVVQAAVYDLVSNRKTIALQSEDKKEKLRGYLSNFASSLNEEQARAWANNLMKLDDACNTVDALDDM
jgi:hypothetical protein